MERNTVKEIILKSMSKKVKPSVLKNNMEGLIDEYLEIHKFITENGSNVDTLPTKDVMKWWFQDPLEKEVLKILQDEGEHIYEIQVDKIYLADGKRGSKKDKIAECIYKTLYKYEWNPKADMPDILKELVKLHQIAITTKNDFTKKFINKRLSDYALLGCVRLYHLERVPYMKITEIEKIVTCFRLILDVMLKMMKGFYGESQIVGSVLLFDGLERFKNIQQEAEIEINNLKPEKKPKKTRKKKTDNTNGS